MSSITERVAEGEPGFEMHLARYRRAALSIPPGARVLDAGSGAGFGTAYLSERGLDPVGIDSDEEAVAQARESYPGPEVIVGDITALPFEDGSFDAVVCFEVIEHVGRPAALVGELARVLRPGGLLAVSTPNARMERLHARAAGLPDNPFHISSLTPRALRGLLRSSLHDVRLYGQAEDHGPLHAVLQALDPLGLRLRIRPSRRGSLQRALGAAAPGATTGGPLGYRFSRLLAASAAITYAEARR